MLRTTNVPCTIRVKSEIVKTAEDVITVRTETGVDGSIGKYFGYFGYIERSFIEFEILPMMMAPSHISSIISAT